MKFKTLKEHNLARFNSNAFHHVAPWKTEHWCLAIAGEAGELCNAFKKVYQSDGCMADVLDEIADVVIYCDLLASHLGMDLEHLVRRKFNEKSKQIGSLVIIDKEDAE